MKLHPINNDTTTASWCGPGAIAAITGLPISEVREAIHEVRGTRRGIKGMYNREVEQVLKNLGYRIMESWNEPEKRPITLAAWLRQRRRPNELNLVVLTTHFVVVKGRKAIDNHTKEPTWIRQFPWRRARVRKVTRIEKCVQ